MLMCVSHVWGATPHPNKKVPKPKPTPHANQERTSKQAVVNTTPVFQKHYKSLPQSKFYRVTESILIVHLNFSILHYSVK